MTGTTLELAHVMFGLERLLKIYTRPKHMDADVRNLAKDYFGVCHDLTMEQFDTAVHRYLQGSEKYFPKPGELRALGKAAAQGPGGPMTLADQYRAWANRGYQSELTGEWQPCPVCGAALDPTRRNGEGRLARLEVVHDHQRHYDAGVGYDGPRTGPTRNGIMLPVSAGANGGNGAP